ncbi:1,25-dihydroxyvitamin D(3) 24-hydroxylase, mitochondrial-like [Haliotis cracherodii]|uniref:1,25-dihydroxyvitamin D(3) 24-hydroxylase, mitochondrial-like n=1 Tax=Haliotis cracherodii TaxID=6455 RepID=UPI0039E8FB1A
MLSRVAFIHVRPGQSTSAVSVLCRYKATSAQTDDHAADVKPFSALPGPKGLPVVGTLFDIMKNSARLNEMIQKRHETYGPIYREKMGRIDAVFLTDVEAVEQLFRQEAKYPVRIQLEHWIKYREDRGFNKGLVMSSGEAWHSLRRVVDQHMMKIKTVESYTGEFNKVVVEFLDRVGRIRTSDKELPALNKELFNWSLESIARILYEKRLGCLSDNRSEDTQAFIQSSHDIFETTRKIFFLPPKLARIFMPRTYKQHDAAWDEGFRVAHKIIDERIREIRETKEEGEHVGFITHFLKEDSMSLKDVYANISELMGAAVDTTSNTAQMLLYELSRHPHAQEAILEEITRVVPPGEQPTADHLKEMHYIKAAIKETLRLYPTGSVVIRVLQQDAVLLGYHVPKETVVWIDLYGFGRLRRHYEDPDTFRPERWLRATRTVSPQPFSWLPFGFGPRMCVGRRVAELEMQLLISQLVRKFQIEPVSMEPVEMKTDLLLLAKDPIRIRLHERD